MYWSYSNKQTGFQNASLVDIFSQCDIIFPCLAENEETKELISDSLLSSMSKKSYFISIIHHFYNHILLLEMVKKGDLAGYAFEENGKKITDFDENIFVTPQYAWFTKESLQNMEDKLFESLEFQQNNQYPNRVK